jgi:hypothetical protein
VALAKVPVGQVIVVDSSVMPVAGEHPWQAVLYAKHEKLVQKVSLHLNEVDMQVGGVLQ